jgi:hypothetical protein
VPVQHQRRYQVPRIVVVRTHVAARLELVFQPRALARLQQRRQDNTGEQDRRPPPRHLAAWLLKSEEMSSLTLKQSSGLVVTALRP